MKTQTLGRKSTVYALSGATPGAHITLTMAGMRLGSVTMQLLVNIQEDQLPVKYSNLVDET